MIRKLLVLVFFCMTGCTGIVKYTPPSQVVANAPAVDFQKSREAVWVAAVPALGREFFVINNLDKTSGLINVSYAGDPEKYIDCGRLYIEAPWAGGTKVFEGAGAAANFEYEVAKAPLRWQVQRTMKLEGRVNLIFEETGPTSSRLTVNTRYIVSRELDAFEMAYGRRSKLAHVIHLDTNGRAKFPGGDEAASECVATGALERSILDTIQRAVK